MSARVVQKQRTLYVCDRCARRHESEYFPAAWSSIVLPKGAFYDSERETENFGYGDEQRVHFCNGCSRELSEWLSRSEPPVIPNTLLIPFALMQAHLMKPGDTATPIRTDFDKVGLVRRLIVATNSHDRPFPKAEPVSVPAGLMIDDFIVAERRLVVAESASAYAADSIPASWRCLIEPAQPIRLAMSNKTSDTLEVSVVVLVEVLS